MRLILLEEIITWVNLMTKKLFLLRKKTKDQTGRIY